MTTIETKYDESNLLIALFMCAEKDGGSTMAIDGTYAESYKVCPDPKYPFLDETFHNKRTYNEIHSISNLQYHTSWSWLMPVCIKLKIDYICTDIDKAYQQVIDEIKKRKLEKS